jgi:hypothetical protein
MAIKIDKQIVDYDVKASAKPNPAEALPAGADSPASASRLSAPLKSAEVIQMHERLERPEMLVGSTYKIKTPLSDHALYVTINDIVLNQGTEHEQRRPFEVFIIPRTWNIFNGLWP